MLPFQIAKLDVTFPKINCTAFNIEELAVQVGEDFNLQLHTPPMSAEPQWFANNDDVLEINATGKMAQIKALKEGNSLVEIQVNKTIIKSILVTIIPAQAATLGIQVENPQDK